MARAPRYKIYDSNGEYVAATKDLILSAAVVSLLGNGGTIRNGHRKVLWTEGKDGRADESYDLCADKCTTQLRLEGVIQ